MTKPVNQIADKLDDATNILEAAINLNRAIMMAANDPGLTMPAARSINALAHVISEKLDEGLRRLEDISEYAK